MFVRDGDYEEWPVGSAPAVIVQIMGLTDDSTMEPPTTDGRKEELVKFYTFLQETLPDMHDRVTKYLHPQGK